MPDLVQTVGRALRIQPGEGKVASLVVPVLLGPGETADSMLTSRAFGGLAKLLEALRAHDARVVEALAEPQARSRVTGVQTRSGQGDDEEREGPDAEGQAGCLCLPGSRGAAKPTHGLSTSPPPPEGHLRVPRKHMERVTISGDQDLRP